MKTSTAIASSTTAEKVPQRRGRFKLASHAMDNARERLAAFHAAHAEIIDEYLRMKDEIRGIAVSLGHLEGNLRSLVRDLGKVYERKS